MIRVEDLIAGLYRVLGNGEMPIVALYFENGGNGWLPYGIVAYDRGYSGNMHEPKRRYSTHQFALQESGVVSFAAGHYDLTKQEALDDAYQRARYELSGVQ